MLLGTRIMFFGPEPLGTFRVAEEVTSIENVSNGMIPIEFSGMQYAHLHYIVTKVDMGYVYDKLIAWIHKNGDYGNGAMIEKWEDSLPYENEQYNLHLYIPFVWKRDL